MSGETHQKDRSENKFASPSGLSNKKSIRIVHRLQECFLPRSVSNRRQCVRRLNYARQHKQRQHEPKVNKERNKLVALPDVMLLFQCKRPQTNTINHSQ